jgi:hypothetical protein
MQLSACRVQERPRAIGWLLNVERIWQNPKFPFLGCQLPLAVFRNPPLRASRYTP